MTAVWELWRGISPARIALYSQTKALIGVHSRIRKRPLYGCTVISEKGPACVALFTRKKSLLGMHSRPRKDRLSVVIVYFLPSRKHVFQLFVMINLHPNQPWICFGVKDKGCSKLKLNAILAIEDSRYFKPNSGFAFRVIPFARCFMFCVCQHVYQNQKLGLSNTDYAMNESWI